MTQVGTYNIEHTPSRMTGMVLCQQFFQACTAESNPGKQEIKIMK